MSSSPLSDRGAESRTLVLSKYAKYSEPGALYLSTPAEGSQGQQEAPNRVKVRERTALALDLRRVAVEAEVLELEARKEALDDVERELELRKLQVANDRQPERASARFHADASDAR